MFRIKKVLGFLSYFLLPFIFVAAIESIFRGDLSLFLVWQQEHRNEFYLTYLLAFGILNSLAFLPRYLYLYGFLLLVSFASALAYFSRLKMQLRGEPLLPWDLSLQREALNISEHFDLWHYGGVTLGALILVAILGFWSLRHIYKGKLSGNNFAIALLAIFLIFISYNNKPIPLHDQLNILTITWNQSLHYSRNGFALGFFLNARLFAIEVPTDYSKEKILALKDDLNATMMSNGEKFTQKPNIIFIMSEAFWDPLKLTNISFNKDPIPFFRQLQQNYTSGNLLVPVYGGATVNTEFEVLTGFSTQFLRDGVIAYTQFIHRPVDSLARTLTEQGYVSTAMHTYHNWFYNRNEVYRQLGFDKYISGEFFNNPQYVGDFISDADVSKEIISEVQRTKERDFIFAVTMQNHGPYYVYGKNPHQKIKVQGDLSPQAKDILEDYAEKLSYSDQALKKLIRFLEDYHEPTIVVFFGDHLPALGENYQVYRETGYLTGEQSYQDYLKMYNVPYVIWNNYQRAKPEQVNLSTNFLASYVLNKAKLEPSPFMAYLSGLYEKGTKQTPRQSFYEEFSVDEREMESYKLLQYDLLFGEQYLYAGGQVPENNKDYYLGHDKPMITEANPLAITAGEVFNAWQDQSTLKIKGKNFSSNSVIYINDEPQTTVLTDDGYLSAVVPNEYYDFAGELAVQVRVIDSQHKVIAQSEEVSIPVKDQFALALERQAEAQKRIFLSQLLLPEFTTWPWVR